MDEEADLVPSPRGVGDPCPGDEISKEVANECHCCSDLKTVVEMLLAQNAEAQYREKRLANKIDDLTRIVRRLEENLDEQVATSSCPGPASKAGKGNRRTVAASKPANGHAHASTNRRTGHPANKAPKLNTDTASSESTAPSSHSSRAAGSMPAVAGKSNAQGTGDIQREKVFVTCAGGARPVDTDDDEGNGTPRSRKSSVPSDYTVPILATFSDDDEDDSWQLVTNTKTYWSPGVAICRQSTVRYR